MTAAPAGFPESTLVAYRQAVVMAFSAIHAGSGGRSHD